IVSFRSKASPLRACGTRRTNLYPAGFNPFQNPSCALRGRGLQGGWDLSLPRRVSALARCRSHIHLVSHKLLLSVFDLRSSPLEDGTSRNQPSFKITPQRHQQLACQRHDGDAADAAFHGTDTRLEPDAQIAVGLIAQPQPGEFDPGGSPLAVAGLADPLVMRHVSALERARREADITRQLAAIVEVTMKYLANQHRGKLRTDRLELMENLDLLGVEMRRCFILGNRVALCLKSGDHLNHKLQTL